MKRFYKVELLLFFISIILGALITYLLLTNKTQQIILAKEPLRQHLQSPTFSVANAPSDSLIGSVSSVSGKVTWLSRTATDEATLVPNTKVQQGVMFSTKKDGHLSFHISACTVTLLPETKLQIIQTLPASLVFEQDGGKAEYSNSCNLPLAVRVHSMLVETKNGSITITDDSDNQSVSVLTKDGTAKVAYNDSDQVSTVTSIPSSHLFLYHTENRSGVLKKAPLSH